MTAREGWQLFFFILSLILSLAVSGILLTGLVKSLQINWQRRNRRPISYLAPVFLMLVFIALSSFLTVPRLLDTVTLVKHDYVIEEIRPRQEDIGWNTLHSEGRRFFFNQWQFQPKPDARYRISYMEHSRYIMDMVEIKEPAVSSR